MPDLTVIGAYLGKAAASYAFRKVASRGVEGLTDYVKRKAKEDGKELTDQDLRTLDGLLAGNNTFFQATFANVVRFKFAGAICVGPSGAGKTSIQTFFAESKVRTPAESTRKADTKATRYGAWTYQVTDTPGQYTFAEARSEAYGAIRNGKERVLMLVCAAGFLKTLGVSGPSGDEAKFKRPHRDAKPTLGEHLAAAVDEEIEWIGGATGSVADIDPAKRFKYVMVVVNKLDQWYDVRDRVKAYYEGTLDGDGVAKQAADAGIAASPDLAAHLTPERSKRFRAALKIILDRWCARSINPSFHYVSSCYDSFYEHAPSGQLSQAAVELSLSLLRGEVRLRFLEG